MLYCVPQLYTVISAYIWAFLTGIGQPAVWGFLSLGSTHCDRVFLLSEVHLWHGGKWLVGLDPLLVAGQPFSFSTLMLVVGSLTCKTVSRMTCTVLVETLNPTHSLTCRWTLNFSCNLLSCNSTSLLAYITILQTLLVEDAAVGEWLLNHPVCNPVVD